MKNLSSVILFLITCNQKIISRTIQNTIDDNLYSESYSAKPYPISDDDDGASPPHQEWGRADYDAYDDSDEHENDDRIVFLDEDWSDEIPSWKAQRKIRQCVTSCQPNSVYQFQPICGTDGVTYHNFEHMQCFMECGVDVDIRRMSPCSGWTGTTSRPSQQPPTTTATLTTTFNIQQQQACMSSCPNTPEYNPVCGNDHVTYYNHGKLICAQRCGKDGFKRPCRDTSPECLKRSLQAVLPDFIKGIPELGIPSLDPFKVENLNFVLPGGINVKIKEGYTRGLRKCHVDSVRNIGEDQYEVIFRCNVLTKGKYRSKGQFLKFPIDGEGDSKIKCRNLKVTCTFRLVPTTKPDGTQHLQILDFKSSHDYEGRVSFDLTNLFRGNPEISNAVLKFLNENWRSVSEKFGRPFFEYGVMGILNNVRKLLDIIPVNQLVTV